MIKSMFFSSEKTFGQNNFAYSYWTIDSLKIEVQKEIKKEYDPRDLILLEYMYDNGRYQEDHKIWIWRNDKIEYFTILEGLEKTKRIDTISNLNFIQFYIDNELASEEHYLQSVVSHDFGYYLQITIDGRTKNGYIRDIRRGIDNFKHYSEEELKLIKEEEESKNPLIKWINLIDKFYKNNVLN